MNNSTHLNFGVNTDSFLGIGPGFFNGQKC